MGTISVIIPVYKVEDYLDRCVQSVLAQTYEDIEVILVDDGSPDGCGAKCDDYAARDSRVKVIHRENGGLSAARNTGLDAVAGEYILFVDGDDYIAPDMAEKLLAALEDTGADMALCDIKCVDDGGTVVRELPPFEAGVFGPEEIYRRMTFDDWAMRYVTAWNRLYRRALFDGLRFEEGKLHEDEFLAHRLYDRCEKVAAVSDELYYYVQRGGSIMSAAVSLGRLDRVQARFERYEFFKEKGFRDLTGPTLRRDYEFLWDVMAHVDVKANRAAIRPWAAAIAWEQLKRLDARGVWLWLYDLRRAYGPGREDA